MISAGDMRKFRWEISEESLSQQYTINEIFYSLQGEGVRAGIPSVFVRFSNCNLNCNLRQHGFDCDTEFESGKKMSMREIINEISKVRLEKTEDNYNEHIVFTGGEPSLQLTRSMCIILLTMGYHLSIETNGTKELPYILLENGMKRYLLSHITVSPKTAEHTILQKYATEVKYVRRHGQGLPSTTVQAEHHLLSPASDGDGICKKSLDWCIQLCLKHPRWRLSMQQHKIWGIR